jgi:hypothetical protein
MTNEEIQRVMEFIIKQQESFAEGMTKSEERTAKLERAFVGLYDLVTDIGKAHKELAEKHKELTGQVSELAEAQAHTDQRVNALIDIIDDQRRNGKSPT